MRYPLLVSSLALVGLAVSGIGAGAQTAPKPATAGGPPAAAPKHDPHDLAGVWNMRPTPAARKYIGSTFSAEEPPMTAWGKQQSDATKPSNGPRTHTLQETDD